MRHISFLQILQKTYKYEYHPCPEYYEVKLITVIVFLYFIV